MKENFAGIGSSEAPELNCPNNGFFDFLYRFRIRFVGANG